MGAGQLRLDCTARIGAFFMKTTAAHGLLTGLAMSLINLVADAAEFVGIDHYAINVADMDRAADWYQRNLGFNILHKWKDVWMVGRGNIKVGLFLRPDAKVQPDVENQMVIQHVAFLVDGDKFAALLDELRAKNVSVDGPEDTGIAYSAFFKDADGHILEITTYHGPVAPQPK